MYVKVFSQIFDSSIADDYRVRHLFEDMLKLANAEGVVDMTQEAISRRTGIPIEEVNTGITKLLAPDPKSRTPDHDGRRLVLLDEHRDWGYRIVNYAKYRSITNEQSRREQCRRAMKRHRAKKASVKQKPKAEKPASSSPMPNGWAIWIDINRERGREDPAPLGPDTAAAKRFLKVLGVEKFKTCCQRFLEDQTPFLTARGHELHLMAPNKYANAEDDAELFSAFNVKRVKGKDVPPEHWKK